MNKYNIVNLGIPVKENLTKRQVIDYLYDKRVFGYRKRPDPDRILYIIEKHDGAGEILSHDPGYIFLQRFDKLNLDDLI